MPGTYEVDQSVGALAAIRFANESDWGVVNVSPNWKSFNVVPGESLDQNLALYESRVIRPDRTSNPQIRGTQRPGGNLPFELAPTGQAQFFYNLLGWKQSNSGAGPYTHNLCGWGGSASRLAQAFPPGITIEKAFLDQATLGYYAFKGSRVNACNLNFNVDSVVQGAFDIIMRESAAPSNTSVLGGNTPTDLTSDPFTSVQVSLYEGASLATLGTSESLSLSITNNMRAKYVLGSNFAANIKPGTRMTTGTGTFLFNNPTLYNKAVAGTDTALEILVTNGTYSYHFLMPAVDFLPINSMPKITDDGPLSVQLNYKATFSTSINSDIQLTIVSPESNITN